jgi:hypothetical protein
MNDNDRFVTGTLTHRFEGDTLTFSMDVKPQTFGAYIDCELNKKTIDRVVTYWLRTLMSVMEEYSPDVIPDTIVYDLEKNKIAATDMDAATYIALQREEPIEF